MDLPQVRNKRRDVAYALINAQPAVLKALLQLKIVPERIPDDSEGPEPQGSVRLSAVGKHGKT